MVALREDSTQDAYTLPINQVICGDALTVLRTLPDNCVDSIVCDPPSGISFMGAKWDTFTGKQKPYDSVAARAKAHADREKVKQHGGGSPPFGFSSSSAQPTAKERENFITFITDVMTEALRVLKPGAFALVWSLPRTSHWTATALENSGFEVRDVLYNLVAGDSTLQAFVASLDDAQRDAFARIVDGQDEQPASILHLFGSGFPKSANVSAMIDKHLGKERNLVKRERVDGKPPGYAGGTFQSSPNVAMTYDSAPATPEAAKWRGWGSATKPACENWIMCRKPLERGLGLAGNTLKWGVGGINVDASRVGTASDMNPCDFDDSKRTSPKLSGTYNGGNVGEYRTKTGTVPNGRYPSHLLLSHSLFCVPQGTKRVKGAGWKERDNDRPFDALFEGGWKERTGNHYTDPDGTEEVESWICAECCPVRLLGLQSGMRKSGAITKPRAHTSNTGYGSIQLGGTCEASTGTAARFFKQFHPNTDLVPFIYTSKASQRDRSSEGTVENTHPTTKSTALMRYLIRMITPENGIVPDMFGGSGTTAVAAIQENMHYLLVEENAEYVAIARARIAYAEGQVR